MTALEASRPLIHRVGVPEIDAAHAGLLVAELHGVLAESFDTGVHDRLTLDLDDVTFLDSTGIAVLIRFNARLAGLGLHLELVNASPPLRRSIELLGLDRRLRLV